VKVLIELLLWVREELRGKKLWDLADDIRSKLRNYCNIHLQDTTYGTRWFIDKEQE
jgi:cysteinyl-tRNA synthetase